MRKIKANLLCCIAIFANLIGPAQSKYPVPAKGDYIIKDFAFESKESLPQLNIQYTTFGKLEK